jgi:hypothetical protein
VERALCNGIVAALVSFGCSSIHDVDFREFRC